MSVHLSMCTKVRVRHCACGRQVTILGRKGAKCCHVVANCLKIGLVRRGRYLFGPSSQWSGITEYLLQGYSTPPNLVEASGPNLRCFGLSVSWFVGVKDTWSHPGYCPTYSRALSMKSVVRLAHGWGFHMIALALACFTKRNSPVDPWERSAIMRGRVFDLTLRWFSLGCQPFDARYVVVRSIGAPALPHEQTRCL